MCFKTTFVVTGIYTVEDVRIFPSASSSSRAVIALACIIFSAMASAPPAVDNSVSAVTAVWSYVAELLFDLLISPLTKFATPANRACWMDGVSGILITPSGPSVAKGSRPSSHAPSL